MTHTHESEMITMIDIQEMPAGITVGQLASTEEGEVQGYRPDPWNDHPDVLISGPQERSYARAALKLGTLREYGREDGRVLLEVTEDTPWNDSTLAALRNHCQLVGRQATFGLFDVLTAMSVADI